MSDSFDEASQHLGVQKNKVNYSWAELLFKDYFIELLETLIRMMRIQSCNS